MNKYNTRGQIKEAKERQKTNAGSYDYDDDISTEDLFDKLTFSDKFLRNIEKIFLLHISRFIQN